MYSIGELSKISAVTVRTLRYYDEIDLLKPADIRKGGRRYYDESNLTTLEYILTLKEIGFDLNEIKQLLKESVQNPRDLLEMRLKFVEEQLNELSKAKKKITTAIQLFDIGDYEHLDEVFSEMQMDQKTKNNIAKARQKNFTSEEQALIANLPQFGENRPITWEWSKLLRDIKRAIEIGVPENSQRALKLAGRWSNLTLEMYEGDAKTAQKAWDVHRKQGNIGFANFNEQAVNYIEKAVYHYFHGEGEKNK